MKSILDRSFRYSSSVHTDLRKTFAKVRREQQRLEKTAAATPATHDGVGPTVFRLHARESAER